MVVDPHALARKWRERFRRELLDSVVPFWVEHSLDREHGGFFDCLDRDGRVFDTSKHVWLQGRETWMFAKLHREFEARDEWLAIARSGAEFLRQHARAADGRVWFQLTADGRPMKMQRKIFAACFYALGLAEFGRAAGVAEYVDEAKDVVRDVVSWVDDPTPLGRETPAAVADRRELATPMILLNVFGEVFGDEREHEFSDRAADCARAVVDHVRPELEVVLETITADGGTLDGSDGRLVNPGHAIEAAWFLLDHVERSGDTDESKLVRIAHDVIRWSLAAGWDDEHGGLFAFVDAGGFSPVPLEWSMKLWWPHCEAIVATLWAAATAADASDRAEWGGAFARVADWTFAHFPDAEFGEWFGYLDRRGDVSQRFKGGPYKGCFHVPRALWLGMKLCDRLLESPER